MVPIASSSCQNGEDMRRTLSVLTLAICSLTWPASADDAHEPAAGTAERKAIMDGIRADWFPGRDVVFVVNYLRVHQGWAWADVSPQNRKGVPVAEGGTALLKQQKDGSWRSIDLRSIPEDPKDPEGYLEASPGFIKNVRKKYPDVPLDIFPQRSRK